MNFKNVLDTERYIYCSTSYEILEVFKNANKKGLFPSQSINNCNLIKIYSNFKNAVFNKTNEKISDAQFLKGIWVFGDKLENFNLADEIQLKENGLKYKVLYVPSNNGTSALHEIQIQIMA